MGKKNTKKKLEAEWDLIMTVIDDIDFIEDIDENTNEITYSKDFFFLMNNLMKEGKSAEEAYEALGFDLKIFGEERAKQASYKAMKLAKAKGYGTHVSDFSGETSTEDIAKYNLTIEEQMAFHKARTYYLQKQLKFADYAKEKLASLQTQSKLNELDGIDDFE